MQVLDRYCRLEAEMAVESYISIFVRFLTFIPQYCKCRAGVLSRHFFWFSCTGCRRADRLRTLNGAVVKVGRSTCTPWMRYSKARKKYGLKHLP